MGFWKTEYAVRDIEGDELAWFDTREDARAEAKRRAAQHDGVAYIVVEIRRYADDREDRESFISDGEGGVTELGWEA